MHITNQKLSFYTFMVGHLRNVYDLLSYNFWHKIKINNFDQYNVLLAIATHIPVLLKTGFVLQGHVYSHI